MFKPKIKKSNILILTVILIAGVLVWIGWRVMAVDNGNTKDYVFSEKTGWIRMDGTDSSQTYGVTMPQTGIGDLSGYAWLENAGWIHFAGTCTEAGGCPGGGNTYAVATTTASCSAGWSCLSGYAWGEGIGWIRFAATGSTYANTSSTTYGVYIDSNSDFKGYAWSEQVGWIHFAGTCTEAGGCPNGLNTYGAGFGSPIYILAITTGKTINISGNLTIGDGTNQIEVMGATNDPNISVTGNVLVADDATFINTDDTGKTLNIDGNLTITGDFTAPAGTGATAFTLGGNFTNNGTFNHNDGMITFDTAATSQLTYSANTTFYKFNVPTSAAGKNIQFDEAQTTIIANDLTIQGTNCTDGRIFLDSYVNDNPWLIYLNTGVTQDINYIDLEDADATGTVVTPVADDSTETGSNTNWTVNEGLCAASITVAGRVCSAEPCNDTNGSGACATANVVGLSVNGGSPTYASCNTTTGAYSFSNVTATSGATIALFLNDNAADASAVIVSDGNAVSDGDFYDDTVVVRSQTGTATIADMMDYDSDQQSGDIRFDAETGVLSVEAGHELHIWTDDTFAPGGTVTLTAGAGSDLHLDDNSTFTAGGAISIGGSWTADTGSTFTHNNNDVTFTAGVSGQTITTNAQSFYNLIFNGSSGQWTPQDAVTVANDLTSTNGTLLGTQNLTVSGGDIICGASCGSISLTGGTTNLSGTGNFGTNALASNWTFYDLTFGDGAAEVSTSQGTGTITVSNVLTIAATHELNAGNKTWTLSKSGTGAGKPLVATGIFEDSTSTVSYEGGAATDVTLVTYNNLTTNGTGPFTAEAGTLTVNGNITAAAGTFNLNGATNVTGNVSIESGATLVSTSGILTITGNYSNANIFTHNSGTVTFDATDAGNTLSGTLNGSSSFNKVIFNGTGGEWAIQDAMKVSADSTSTFVIGNGTVTLGNGGGDHLEINGKMTIAATSGQTGTFQTMDGLAQGNSTDCDSDDICIDVNNNTTPVSCANCIIQVGTTGADAGQGNLKIRENALVRLNPFTTASDTGIEVEKNGYLEILGDLDDTGTATGTTETTITASAESWGSNDHQYKQVRITNSDSLAFGTIHDISSNTDTVLTIPDNFSVTDTGSASYNSGTRIYTATVSMISADNDGIGQYLYNSTQGKRSRIVDSTEAGTSDTIKIANTPDTFVYTATDSVTITYGILTDDTFEILDYAHISAENGTACDTTVGGSFESYIYAKQDSETLIQYADICNLGRNAITKQGVSFYTVDGSQSNEGVTVDKSRVHDNYCGIYYNGSSNNTLSSNQTYDNTYGIHLNSSSNNNTAYFNQAFGNSFRSIYLYTSSNNTIYSNQTFGNPSFGIYIYSNSNNNTIYSNQTFGNTNYGIHLDNSSNNNILFSNQSYSNARGLSIENSSNTTIINDNYGGSGANSTADIYFNDDTSASTIRCYNCTMASSTEVSNIAYTGAYVISSKHDTTSGSTKIWGEYSVPDEDTETPQIEATNKFNYVDNSWVDSITDPGYSGTGDKDETLSLGFNGAMAGANSAYAYFITLKTANAQCDGLVGSAVFDVYRDTVDIDDVYCGEAYTDSTTNAQFTINQGGTAYVIGDTYTFVAFKASGDTDAQKPVTMMQDGDKFTAGSGKTVEMKGQSAGTNLTQITRGTGSYQFDIAGTIDAQYYSFDYLGGGGNGLDLQSGATITNIADGAFANFVNVGAADTYIKVHGDLIGTGSPAKTFANVSFTEVSDNVPEYTVTVADGTPSNGNYWLFDTTATCTGWSSCEDSDSDSGDGAVSPNAEGFARFTIPGFVVSGRVCSAEPCNDTNGSAACDGVTSNVALSINGGTPATTTCNATTGAYSFASVSAGSGATITIFLDDNADDASAVVVSNGSTITDTDFYDDTVVVRSQTGTITINDMVSYDSDQQSGDIRFDAETGVLNVEAGHELHIWTGDTFAPGGTVTLAAGSGSDLHIDDSATFTAGGAISIGGSWTADASSTFTHNDNTVTFSAGVSGQTITTNAQSFYNLIFNGSSGQWTATTDALTVNNNLTVTAGNFDTGAVNNAITGATSVTGTLTISSITGTKTFTGDVTVNAGGTWNETAAEDVSFGGNLTNNQTFTSSTGVHTFTGTDKSINGTIAIPNLTISGTTTNNDTLTVSTALSGASTLTNAATGTLNIGGTSGITGLTATASGNTVDYNGTAQTVKPVSYHHLILSNTDAKTMTSVTTIGGDLTISGAATMTGNAAFTVTGVLNYSSSGSTTLTAATSISIGKYNQSAGTIVDNGNTITVTGTGAGVWTKSGGTFTATGTATFTGSDPGIGASNFNNLIINVSGGGATATLEGAITVGNDLTISAGALDVSTTDYGITVRGNWDNNGTFTCQEGTVTFDAGDTGNTIDHSSSNFHNLTFNNSAGGWILSATTLTVTNNFIIIDGEVTAVANDPTINIGGDLTVDSDSDNNGSFVKGDGTLTFNGDQTYTALVNDTGTGGDFTRRKEITITTAGTSTPANYQVKITVAYDSDMQTDFQDIRFNTKSGGYIDYWIESKTTSTTADVWLELPDAITDPGSDTIWMYYGNGGLSDGGDGDDVFEFFDDFEDGVFTDKWDDLSWGLGTVNEASGKLRIYGGSSAVADNSGYVGSKTAVVPAGYRVDIDIDIIANGWSLNSCLQNSQSVTFTDGIYFNGYSGELDWDKKISSVITAVDDAIIGTGEHSIGLLIESDGTCRFWEDGTEKNSGSGLSTNDMYITQYCRRGADIYWLLLKVRQYIANEPTPTLGSEEQTYDWTDNNSTKSDMGDVVIGANVNLGSNVKATNLTINADKTLDATTNDHSMNIGGNWDNNGTFTCQEGTVTFDASSGDKTINDGSSEFYNIKFDSAATSWTYTDEGTTVATNSTELTSNVTGTVNFINARTGASPTVTAGTLNIDWYLGIHAVNANGLADIETDTANDITISENTGTPAATIWKYSSGWGSPVTSQTTGTDSNGKNIQPHTDGAVKIREYSNVAGTPTYYLYNLDIVSQTNYSAYDYYGDYGDKYLTSTLNTSSGHDEIISDSWHRSTPGTINAVGTLNDPPVNGTWYVGMLTGLEVEFTTGDSITFADLAPDNFSDTASTKTRITVSTSAANGYVVTAWEDGLMTCATCPGTPTIQNFYGTYATPQLWSDASYCKDNSNFCGFGFTSSDTTIDTYGDLYVGATKYAGFPNGFANPIRVMDYDSPASGIFYDITYRISVSNIQQAGDYSTNIVYVVTAEY